MAEGCSFDLRSTIILLRLVSSLQDFNNNENNDYVYVILLYTLFMIIFPKI